MNSQPPDPDLRGLFQELREEDRARAPSFKRMMAPAREGAESSPEVLLASGSSDPSLLFRRLAWGGSLLVAATAAALLLLPGPGTTDAEFELTVRAFSTHPAGGAWRSPTDGLLDIPGSEALSTLPRIGSRSWGLGTRSTFRPNQL